MKKNNLTLLTFVITAMILFGCGQDPAPANEDTPTASLTMVEGTFNIEAVRNSLIIKGYRFSVPQKITDLDEGLTCKFIDEEFDNALYQVEIYDQNGLVMRTLARNAHNKSKKAELYNIAVEGSDSSVAGIVPTVTTAEEVLKQFGEPATIIDNRSEGRDLIYKYGQHNVQPGYQTPGKFMNVIFDQSGVVKTIIVQYLE